MGRREGEGASMKYSELKIAAAEARRALKEERDLKVEKLRLNGPSRLNKLVLKQTLDRLTIDGDRHTVHHAEERAAQKFVQMLLAAGVIERRSELKHDEVEVFFTLLVGTDNPTEKREPVRDLWSAR